MKKDHVNTQIRIPENMYFRLKELSNETGGSLNSTMLHLMHLGLRIYDDGFTVNPANREHRQS